jgi:YD repeat-containing protein
MAFPHNGPSTVVGGTNAVGHTAGDLQSITNAAGHVTQFTLYDRAGRVRQMVDPKGVVTDTVYTPEAGPAA